MASVKLDLRDRRNILIILGALCILYGALISNHWSRGTDTSYYIGIARSIMTGHGYEFNSSKVGLAPPGWPFVLSLLMRVSSSFLFLNTANTLILAYSVICAYFVLRRFLDPDKALITTLLSSVLYWNYSSGMHLRTEALFAAIFFQTLLFSLRLSEGKRWSLPVVLLGCALMPLIRYASIAAGVLVAAAIMHNKPFKIKATRDEYKAFWKSMALVGVAFIVLIGSFVASREILIKKILPKHYVPRQSVSSVNLDVKNMDISDREEGGVPVMQGIIGSASAWLAQGLSAGQWTVGHFWMPAQAFNTIKTAALVVNVIGFLFIIVMIPPAYKQLKGGSYLLAAALLYSAMIITRWASIKTRYLMPVSPFLMASMLAGLEAIFSLPSVQRVIVRVFAGSILLANFAPWAYDVFIARSGDRFYHYSDAGELDELVSAAYYLRAAGVRDGEVAINNYTTTFNKWQNNGYELRGLFMLLNKNVTVVPNAPTTGSSGKGSKNPKASTTTPSNLPPLKWNLDRWRAEVKDGVPPNPALLTYCKLKGVRFYLYRPPEAMHTWHIRRSDIRVKLGLDKPKPPTPWVLYELVGDEFIRVDFPRGVDWPTEVPM